MSMGTAPVQPRSFFCLHHPNTIRLESPFSPRVAIYRTEQRAKQGKMPIQSRCAVDRTRLANLRVRIHDIEEAVSALRKEKNSLQARLDAYKYPVLTLPNEIVSEIFTQFLPLYPICPPSTGLLSPMLLTKICRRWRQIALSSPALWRAISLPFGMPDSERRTECLTEWLARSCSLPLSIQMISGGHEITPVDWAIIVPHRVRWQLLNIRTRQPTDLGFLGHPMPLLRQLDLSLSPCPSERAIIQQSPQLCTATLGRSSSYVILPWAQLTVLTLPCMFSWECAVVLQECLNLVHCQIILVSSEGEDDLDPINLPTLKSLALVKFASEEHAGTRLLETFTVPALSTLQISDEFLAPGPIGTLDAFFESSGCKPQDVCITGRRSLSRASYRAAFPSVTFSFKRRLINDRDIVISDDDSDAESNEDEDD
ncbi:hypothetical protein C8R43DRAFT_1241019 [Mycena crocata]|nr:hypothetical protein C8R43DRAFT_1241019 [Mycena crocata]